MRHDLRNALDEAHPESIYPRPLPPLSNNKALQWGSCARSVGFSPPPETSCGTVGAAQQSPTAPKTVPIRTGPRTSFCARACIGHRTRAQALACHEVRGGRKQHYNQFKRDVADIAAVTNRNAMFNGAAAFNQDIGRWNTAAVRNMPSHVRERGSFQRQHRWVGHRLSNNNAKHVPRRARFQRRYLRIDHAGRDERALHVS
jgi:surface protein